MSDQDQEQHRYRQGLLFERGRILVDLRAILESGGTLEDFRAYVEALDGNRHTRTQVDLAGTGEDFQRLVRLIADSLDAHQRYWQSSTVHVQAVGDLVLLTIGTPDKTLQVQVHQSLRVTIRGSDVQDFGILDPDELDPFFQQLRLAIADMQ